MLLINIKWSGCQTVKIDGELLSNWVEWKGFDDDNESRGALGNNGNTNTIISQRTKVGLAETIQGMCGFYFEWRR